MHGTNGCNLHTFLYTFIWLISFSGFSDWLIYVYIYIYIHIYDILFMNPTVLSCDNVVLLLGISKAFRGSKHLLTRYLEDFGCLGYYWQMKV